MAFEYIPVGGLYYPKKLTDEFVDYAIRLASLRTLPNGTGNMVRDYDLALVFLGGEFELTDFQKFVLDYAITHPLFSWGLDRYVLGPGGGYCRGEPRKPKITGYSLIAPTGECSDADTWVADAGQEMWTSAVPSHYYNEPGDYHLFRPTDFDPIVESGYRYFVPGEVASGEVPAEPEVPVAEPLPTGPLPEYIATPFGPVRK